MKFTFRQQPSDEVEAPISFTVEGDTPIQCLAAIERELIKYTGEVMCFTFDFAFDAKECIEAMMDGETYHRNCFSTPEENFFIEPA